MRIIKIFVFLILVLSLLCGCTETVISSSSTTQSEKNDISDNDITDTYGDVTTFDESTISSFESEAEISDETAGISLETIEYLSWDFEKCLTKWTEVKTESPPTNCTVFVREKELQNIKYAHLYKEEDFAILPLISIVEELGATVKWYGEKGDEKAAILYNGKLYILYVQYASVFDAETGQDYFFGIGGNTRSPYFAFVENEFLVDSTFCSCFLTVLDVHINVDSDSSCVFIYDKDTDDISMPEN